MNPRPLDFESSLLPLDHHHSHSFVDNSRLFFLQIDALVSKSRGIEKEETRRELEYRTRFKFLLSLSRECFKSFESIEIKKTEQQKLVRVKIRRIRTKSLIKLEEDSPTGFAFLQR